MRQSIQSTNENEMIKNSRRFSTIGVKQSIFKDWKDIKE